MVLRFKVRTKIIVSLKCDNGIHFFFMWLISSKFNKKHALNHTYPLINIIELNFSAIVFLRCQKIELPKV
jgi:hypothetical protein